MTIDQLNRLAVIEVHLNRLINADWPAVVKAGWRAMLKTIQTLRRPAQCYDPHDPDTYLCKESHSLLCDIIKEWDGLI